MAFYILAVAGSEYKITQDLLSCQLCQWEPEFFRQIEEWNKTVEKQAQCMRELVSYKMKVHLPISQALKIANPDSY